MKNLVEKRNALIEEMEAMVGTAEAETRAFNEEELAKKRMAGIEYSRNSSWDIEAKKVYDAVVDGIEEDRKAKNL